MNQDKFVIAPANPAVPSALLMAAGPAAVGLAAFLILQWQPLLADTSRLPLYGAVAALVVALGLVYFAFDALVNGHQQPQLVIDARGIKQAGLPQILWDHVLQVSTTGNADSPVLRVQLSKTELYRQERYPGLKGEYIDLARRGWPMDEVIAAARSLQARHRHKQQEFERRLIRHMGHGSAAARRGAVA